MYKCLAQFKDTHISLHKSMNPTNITTGVSAAQVFDGRLYISRIRPKVLSKIEEIQKLPADSLAMTLKPGTEILSIDDKSPDAAIKELEAYSSASSDLARESYAASDLFSRRYNYPSSSDVKLSLKLKDGSVKNVVLPWLFVVQNGSVESHVMLEDKGILKSSDLNPDSAFTGSRGFDTTYSLFDNLENQQDYQNGDEDTIMSTGISDLNGKKICYMQLNSFDIEPTDDYGFKVFSISSDGKKCPLTS